MDIKVAVSTILSAVSSDFKSRIGKNVKKRRRIRSDFRINSRAMLGNNLIAILTIRASPFSSIDNILGDYTLCAWIKPRTWGEGGWGRIFQHTTSGTSGWIMGLDGVGDTRFDCWHQAVVQSDYHSTDVVTLNEWQYLCCVHDDMPDCFGFPSLGF